MQTGRMLTPAEFDRETAKQLLFSGHATPDDKLKGIALMIRSSQAGDPEAMYYIGRMMLEGKIHAKAGNSQEYAVSMLCNAANEGFLPARTLLTQFCEWRYSKSFPAGEEQTGPLTDFNGNVVKINCSGALTPVDALLEYKEGMNVLTFSLNLSFVEDPDSVPDPEKLHEAVRRGILAWEGDYTVFGGQKLRVKINITEENRLFDNVGVVVMNGVIRDITETVWNRMDNAHTRELKQDVLEDRRAMAMTGMGKWSVRSRKIIYLQTYTGDFTEYDNIADVMKHEFGHVLGLGDLYAEDGKEQSGVPAGTYPELDSYLIKDDAYHLVMCSQHGPISNNDMEMVVLAFSENRRQQYQPSKVMKQISKALGRGN